MLEITIFGVHVCEHQTARFLDVIVVLFLESEGMGSPVLTSLNLSVIGLVLNGLDLSCSVSVLRMPKTPKERRRVAREAFLGGQERQAHVNKSDVRKSFEEDCSMPNVTSSIENQSPRSSNSTTNLHSLFSVCSDSNKVRLFKLGLAITSSTYLSLTTLTHAHSLLVPLSLLL